MLYLIDGKVYILSSGYYKEVVVSLAGKEYDVKIKENGNRIEYVHNERKTQISVKEAYDMTHKKNSMSELS